MPPPTPDPTDGVRRRGARGGGPRWQPSDVGRLIAAAVAFRQPGRGQERTTVPESQSSVDDYACVPGAPVRHLVEGLPTTGSREAAPTGGNPTANGAPRAYRFREQ